MTYISFSFYVFLLLVLVVYYIIPLQLRWIGLLLGSIIFYFVAYKTGWWILFLTILISYAAGIFLEFSGGGGSPNKI